jgi:pimeloyl-ACP methyl ester carboxylesterase
MRLVEIVLLIAALSHPRDRIRETTFAPEWRQMMCRMVFLALISAAALAAAIPASGADTGLRKEASLVITQGSGSFEMLGGRGHEQHTIRVHYHRPATFNARSPILIVLAGAGRNADRYRDSWIDASEKHGVLILSPTYEEKDYDIAAYHFGGIIKNIQMRNLQGDDPQVYRLNDEDIEFEVVDDASQWLFHDFDRLFDQVVKAVASRLTGYDIFGHSAGGQILHRLAIFYPQTKAVRLVAANSGFYTLPRLDSPLLFGVQGTVLTEDSLKKSFRKSLVVFLGELDNERETRGIHLHTPKADAQGLGRLARGHYFHDESRKLAAALDSPFNWALQVVPGVGHEQEKMAAAAAQFLYGK